MKILEESSVDLSALFGIDIDRCAGDAKPALDAIICAKCRGGGKFIGWSGKAVGKCFSCDGTGFNSHAGPIKAGDCAKCSGSGEWRPGRPCFACAGTGKEVAAAAISVTSIVTAFQAAHASGVKRPRLRLADFTFSRAPDHGKNAGSIYVTRGEDYLGKITAGMFHATVACDAETKAAVVDVASNALAAAKAYGLKTGSCSCCGRALTNGESIDLGIGPICAEKFGW